MKASQIVIVGGGVLAAALGANAYFNQPSTEATPQAAAVMEAMKATNKAAAERSAAAAANSASVNANSASPVAAPVAEMTLDKTLNPSADVRADAVANRAFGDHSFDEVFRVHHEVDDFFNGYDNLKTKYDTVPFRVLKNEDGSSK